MAFKYVIIETETGLELPIIFDLIFDHFYFVKGKKVVSAGFCSFVNYHDNPSINVWGESKTLKLMNRLEVDENLIKKSSQRE